MAVLTMPVIPEITETIMPQTLFFGSMIYLHDWEEAADLLTIPQNQIKYQNKDLYIFLKAN